MLRQLQNSVLELRVRTNIHQIKWLQIKIIPNKRRLLNFMVFQIKGCGPLFVNYMVLFSFLNVNKAFPFE